MQTPVRVGILGPFELTVDGRAAHLPGHVRGLLAVLALRAGHPVPVSTIIDALWGEGPPASDRNTLQTYVAQLRRALEPERAPNAAPSLLVTVTADAYRLDLPREAVDALIFEDLVRRARSTEAATERLGLLQAALALWRGEPLTGVTADGFTAAGARLAGLWRQARLLHVDALLGVGEAEAAVAAAEDTLDTLRYDEGLWAAAVRAYAAAGRRAEALAIYARARRTLVSDLGLEPGAELRAAEAAVLACTAEAAVLAGEAASAAATGAGAIRVVLAEDDLLVREGLLRVLERLGDVRVLAAAGSLDELLDAVERHRPDVVVTDICMPPDHGDEGLQAAGLLRHHHPGVGVLVLSQYADPAYAHQLLAAGARGRGYLIKDRLGHRGKLGDAIRAVHAGESRIDPDIVDLLVAYRGGRGRRLVSPDADPALRTLDRFVAWDQRACFAGVVAVLAVYAFADRSPVLLVEAAAVAAGGLGLGLARRPLRRGDATSAVTVIALVSWLTMVAPVVITPWVSPLMLVSAQLPVVLGAPHVSARRLAAFAAGAAASTLATVTLARTVDLGAHAPAVPAWVPATVLFGFLPVLAALLGLICRHNQVRQAETLAQLRSSRARVLTATDDARRRIARDLHDGAQQHLVAAALDVDVLADLLDCGAWAHRADAAEAQRVVEELRAATATALAELRTLAAGIYATALADYGLATALRSVVARFPRASLHVAPGMSRQAPAVEAAAYFSCVEAVQNAVKHAGPTATVIVALSTERQCLTWTVSDDGAGFDPGAACGVGLLSMADRLEALGGRLRVRSTVGAGTVVEGTIPFPLALAPDERVAG